MPVLLNLLDLLVKERTMPSKFEGTDESYRMCSFTIFLYWFSY